MDQQTISYYQANAHDLSCRYEGIESGLAPHFATAFTAGGKVLDIGCGSGRDLARLHQLGYDVYGAEPTAEFIAIAEQLHPELRGKITQAALPDLPPPFGGNFDGILCSAVLMHINAEYLAPSVKAITTCLSRQGRLLFSVPSKRLDAAVNQRDIHGRLFVPNQSDMLLSLFAAQGLQPVAQWGNADSLGRDTVEWASFLLQRISN